jgi:diadenosine tetraphosphate (Ap4A) HIT family hydrolase
MNEFQINERLRADCVVLAKLDLSHLLLMNNSLVPWFILVPETEAVELYDLSREDHARLTDEIRLVSRFVESEFEVEKLNVAAIGNIVRQMHIHVIGRRTDDFAWPGPVWGRPEKEAYLEGEIARLVSEWKSFAKNEDR